MPAEEPVAGLAEVVDELYVLPPEDFTGRRDELAAEARTAGDKPLAAAVKKLRRPTAGAWALNLLSREEAGLVAQLLDVGAALRQAQEGLDGGAMRELAEQRRGVVGALARRAGALARERGHPLDAPVQRQVEQSLAAALADPDAGAAVTSGQLTRPVEPSGFGFTVDPEAIAVPSLVLVRGGKASGGGAASRPSSVSKPSSEREGEGAPASLDDARARRAGGGRPKGSPRGGGAAARAERERAERERAEAAEAEAAEAEAAEQARREAEEAERAEQERRRAEAEAALQAARDAVEAAVAARAEAQQEADDAAHEVEELQGRLDALETEREELQARLAEVEEQHALTQTALAEQRGREGEGAAVLSAAARAVTAAERKLRALEKRS